MKLHENKEEFKELIEFTSQHLDIRQVYVEKDYWVTYVLKELSKSKYCADVVFKGGTSLSKAYKIIERFSEDIDLVVLLKDGMSGNKIKNFLSDVEKKIITAPIVIDPLFKSSKGSKIRKTGYKYPRYIKDDDFGHAVDTLILELSAFTNPHPVKKMAIQSYVADFLNQKGDKKNVQKYDLGPFSIFVLDVSRTFTEKVLSLARISDIDNEKLSQTKSKIRHFYDIHKIMESNILDDFLKGEEFSKTLELVLADDFSNSEFKNDWNDGKLKDVKLFKNLEEILRQLDSTFNQEFKTLLYKPETEKFENVKKSFRILLGYIPSIQISKK